MKLSSFLALFGGAERIIRNESRIKFTPLKKKKGGLITFNYKKVPVPLFLSFPFNYFPSKISCFPIRRKRYPLEVIWNKNR